MAEFGRPDRHRKDVQNALILIWQEMLFGERAAINQIDGPAHMLKHSEDFNA